MGFRGLCLLVAAVFCLAPLSGSQAQSPPRSGADEPWQRFEGGKGAFSVLLPGKPSEEYSAAKDAEQQISQESFIYSVTAAEEGFFFVQYSLLAKGAESWPDSQSEEFYQGFWRGFSASLDKAVDDAGHPLQTKLVVKKKAVLGGRDGVEYVFTLGVREGRVRITRVGRRAFSAVVIGKEAVSAETQEKFFGSFVIKEAALPAQRALGNRANESYSWSHPAAICSTGQFWIALRESLISSK